MRTMVFRLILFYILSIGVMVAMTPWNRMGNGTISGSPFVQAFASVGIPYAATIMNIVVITAALSSANTNLYLSTRMLFSLARGQYAPALLGQLSANGVPHRALVVSSLGMAAAIILAIYAPKHAFLLMYGSAVAGMYFVWIVILLAHLRFRKAIGGKVNDLPLRLRLFPVPNILGIFVLIAIGCSTFYVDGLQYSVPAFALFLGVISFLYWTVYRAGKAASGTVESGPASSSTLVNE
jgi:L-asparagine transporter-like permease